MTLGVIFYLYPFRSESLGARQPFKTWQRFFRKIKLHLEMSSGDTTVLPLHGVLGKWCRAQQRAFSRNQLSAAHLVQLLGIGFPLKPGVSIWEKRKVLLPSREKTFFSKWFWQFENLRKFRTQHKGRLPKWNEPFPKGNNLNRWIAYQNKRYGDGNLEWERVQLLKQVGFPFLEIRSRNEKWMQQYRFLKEYRQLHSHRWPSQKENFPEGNRLGTWLFMQRRQWIDGKMPLERIRLFQELGVPQEMRMSAWMQRYEKLKEYLRKKNGIFPPTVDGNALGRWTHKQRQFHRQGWLSQEKRVLLNRIGFQWKILPTQWLKQYSYLRDFLQKNRARLPRIREEYPSGNGLGQWAFHQRQMHQSGRLSHKRRRMLEKLGFVWNPRESDWMERYHHLRRFAKMHGRIPFRSEEYPPGQSIGNWVHGLRSQYRRRKLDPEKKKLLDRLGFTWNPYRDEWMEFYRKAESVLHKKGRLPKRSAGVKESKLARWLEKQRARFRRGNLDRERIQLLKRLAVRD